MNEDIIIKMVQPYLKNSSITYEEFDSLFEMLSRREQYNVLDVLNSYNIELRPDEEENIEPSNEKLNKIEKDLDEVSVMEEDFTILYDDSILSDKNDIGKKNFREMPSVFLEVKKNIKQSNEILCSLIHQGNKQAEQDLCIKNRRLVAKVARRYESYFGNDLSFDDLEQAGMIGMLTAAKKFNSDLGYSFSTYAMWWIKQAIVREIYDHGFTIRIPVHIMEMIQRVLIYNRDLSMLGLEYKKKIKIIAEKLSTSEENIEKCLIVQRNFLNDVSLDMPVGEDEDTTVLELIPNEAAITVEEEVFESLLREQIDEAMESLTEREQKILDMRYGLSDGIERTLEEIGSEFKVTRERIRQIESRALGKLSHPSRSRKYIDFLN